MNKEELKAYHKIWYQANKDKVKAYSKVYRKANPEQQKAYHKAYRENHKEQRNLYNRIYRKINKEKVNLSHRIYRRANPEKHRQNERERRALKHEIQVERINEKEVYLRDGWICQHCKKRVNKRLNWPHPMCASLDHIVPLSKSGTHTYDNVQLAHLSCNVSKNNKILPQGEQIRLF